MSRYPSELELKAIEEWDAKDLTGLVTFVEDIWSDYGWMEVKGKNIKKVTLVTGGWSGNEDIVRALDTNLAFRLSWEASFRGGKHIYKIQNLK